MEWTSNHRLLAADATPYTTGEPKLSLCFFRHLKILPDTDIYTLELLTPFLNPSYSLQVKSGTNILVSSNEFLIS